MTNQAPVSAIVLTYNEEENIRECLESLAGWVDELFVVDSYSTDRTVEIAEEYADRVVEHEFENYAAQRNWAQAELPLSNEWVLHVDADERVTSELAEEISEKLRAGARGVDGYLVAERSYFMGRWIRHGDMYPVYHLRLFRRDAGRCEARNYDQHYLCDGPTERLEHDLVEENEFDLEAWTARHNRWSTAEAREAVEGEQGVAGGDDTVEERLLGTPIERRRWLKNRLFYQSPLFVRPFVYFLYRYVAKRGYLDGVEGLIYHVLQAFWFRFLVDAKIYELRKKSN